MFSRFASLVARYWVGVLAAWVVAAAVLHAIAPRWDAITNDGDFAYLPARMTSVRGEQLLQAAFPRSHSRSQVVLVAARPNTALEPADFAIADALVARYTAAAEEPRSPILAVWSYESDVVGGKLITRAGTNGQAVLVVLKLRSELMAVGNMPLLAGIYRTLDALRAERGFPKGLELGVTGSAAIGADMLFAAEQSIRNTEWLTVAMVAGILLLVYRAPGMIIVPLATIFTAVFVATDLVALLAQTSRMSGWFDFQVYKTTRIFIVVILYGAGTDFCLFLIARYGEELRRGAAKTEAIAIALRNVGSAIFASALTTIVGLAMMVFAEFGKFRNGGPAVALSVAVVLLAALTIAPALLSGLGSLLFWPWAKPDTRAAGTRLPTAPPQEAEHFANRAPSPQRPSIDDDAPGRLLGPVWRWLSGLVLARPAAILIAAIVVAAVPAISGLSAPVTYDWLSELHADRPSVYGTQLLRQHFLPGEIGPTTLVVRQPGRDFLSPQGQRQIANLTKWLYEYRVPRSALAPDAARGPLNGEAKADATDVANGGAVRAIVSVRSLAEPLGDRPGTFNPFTAAGRRKLAVLKNPKTIETFVSKVPPLSGEVTRFDLILAYDPFSRRSLALVDRLEKDLAVWLDANEDWHGATFGLSGTTPGIRDLASVNASDRLRIELLVAITVWTAIVIVLGHPLVCVFLVGSVVVGYLVTLGSTAALFAWLDPQGFQGLDWKVPIFLFVILVAIGADYNIYLVSRVFEERKQRGPREGLRVAMVKTGGIITSCGVVMAATFIAMCAASLRAMQQLGFALAMGILLDTFVIRTVLVPAFLVLLNRAEAGAEGSDRGKEDAAPASR